MFAKAQTRECLAGDPRSLCISHDGIPRELTTPLIGIAKRARMQRSRVVFHQSPYFDCNGFHDYVLIARKTRSNHSAARHCVPVSPYM